MPSIKNYGFTKTIFKDNYDTLRNEIEWQGDYDGKIANIDVNINDNGNAKLLSMQLNNNDIKQLFGIQPVEVPLEKRLVRDFLYKQDIPIPIDLEGTLIKRKSRRHRHRNRNKKKHKKRKTRKNKKFIFN